MPNPGQVATANSRHCRRTGQPPQIAIAAAALASSPSSGNQRSGSGCAAHSARCRQPVIRPLASTGSVTGASRCPLLLELHDVAEQLERRRLDLGGPRQAEDLPRARHRAGGGQRDRATTRRAPLQGTDAAPNRRSGGHARPAQHSRARSDGRAARAPPPGPRRATPGRGPYAPSCPVIARSADTADRDGDTANRHPGMPRDLVHVEPLGDQPGNNRI